jgi:hypothetical protein
MVNEINDPGWNLEVYRSTGGDPMAKYWDAGWFFWCDDELTLDNGWFSESTSNQDSTLLHEISHGQGTDDNISNAYNDAQSISGLMYVDKEDWIFFVWDKIQADKQCKQ